MLSTPLQQNLCRVALLGLRTVCSEARRGKCFYNINIYISYLLRFRLDFLLFFLLFLFLYLFLFLFLFLLLFFLFYFLFFFLFFLFLKRISIHFCMACCFKHKHKCYNLVFISHKYLNNFSQKMSKVCTALRKVPNFMRLIYGQHTKKFNMCNS
jgi:hypothetical protein